MAAAAFQESQWRMIGPFRGGRTVAISGVPSQPNVFYMAAVNGGVWKTTDYGQNWAPIFDDQSTGSVGALVVSPSNPEVIYVGSGEGLQRPDLAVGNGIYKSTDGGKTWAHLGLADGRQIGGMAIDPKNPDRVFVAVLGHPYGANEERGLYRTLDGGKIWKKILYKDENTGAVQVVLDPKNPNTVYVHMWSARQGPWEYDNGYTGKSSGLYKSTDGGENWTQLTKGLPGVAESLGRIGLAVAQSDPSRLYGWVTAAKGTGIYRSDDAGESWTLMNSEGRVTGRGDDFAGVTVDPRNKDVVYVANTSTYRSEDGGKTFTAIKGAPGGDDYHTIWINPEKPEIMAIASDQGATITVNGGNTWSSWYNQPTAQMYHVATDNRFPYWAYGGQQESGSAGVASRSDYGEITFREWHPVGIDEYAYAAPDPLNPKLIYGGKGTVFNQATGEFRDVSPHVLRSGKYRYDRTAAIIFAHADPHTLYLASQVLLKTTNGGNSWDVISPDLTRPDPGVPVNLGEMAAADKTKHRGVIYSIGPSWKDVNTIWVGTSDGLIQVTRNGGKSWQNVTPPELTAWSKVSQVEASHFDEQSAYASVSRFRLDDLTPLIYRTHDGGKSWQKITAGLPADAPVNVVREDPERKGLLYAGTESTVYYSLNDGESWQPLRLNLPVTSVRDLVVHQDDLVIGTHGRGFWILDDVTPLRQMNPQSTSAAAFLFRPQAAYRLRRDQWTDTPLPPEISAGKNPPNGAIIDYTLKAASTPVTLEILNAAGKVLRKYSSDDQASPITPEPNVPKYWIRPFRALPATAGMHRFVWDMRLAPPQALQHEFPISAIYGDTPREPLGALVPPGQYSVRLTANGKTLIQPLLVKLDPRVKTAPADIERQFALEQQISEAMERSFAASEAVSAARKRVPADSALAKQLAKLSGDEDQGFFGDPASGFSTINGSLGNLLVAIDGADAAPTMQQQAVATEVFRRLNALLSQWKQVK